MFEPWARLPVRFAADFVHRPQHSVCIALLRYIQGNGRVLSGCALLQSTRFILSRAVLIILFVRGDIAHGQQPEAGSDAGKQWAIVVAVQNHDDPRLNNIRFTQNDALELRRILMERAGVPGRQVIELIDESPAQRRPTLINLRSQLRAALLSAEIGPNDRILVYFSGHGTLVDGQTYLVPSDASLQNRKESCYPVQELHDLLKSCRCQRKMLVLDCCYAGGDLSERLQVPDGSYLVDAVNVDEVPGCVVMASSSRREQSLEWPARKQGLFSYWFCKGLEGGADENGNDELTFDELYSYTEQHVSRTARQVFERRQTAVRHVNFDIAGDPVVIKLLHEHPETVCRRLAAHLDLDAREHGLKRIGFLEFRTPIDNRDELARANLPRLAAERIRIAMNALRGDSYDIVTDERLTLTDNTKALTVEAIGQPQSLQALRETVSDLDAVVWGRLDRRSDRITLQCELLRVSDSERLATPTGSFPLSEDLFGDWGASFDNRNSPDTDSPYAPAVIQYIDHESRTPPTQKSDFPFVVEIWSLRPRAGESAKLIADELVQLPQSRVKFSSGTVFVVTAAKGDSVSGMFDHDGQRQAGTVSIRSVIAAPKKKEFLLTPGSVERDKELLVEAEMHEMFEIRVQNHLGADVAMTLLVDGINTRGMQREWLGQAKSWVIPPTGKDSYRVIEGWYPETDTERLNDDLISTTMQRFRFGKLSNAVANRRGFSDSLGVITAAFYASSGRAVGVEAGPEEYRKLEMKTFRPGKLLGVVNVRYLEASQPGR